MNLPGSSARLLKIFNASGGEMMSVDFEYKIASKNGVSLVTLKGKLCKEAKSQLENCLQEIMSANASHLILYFKDNTTIEPGVFREFTLLQQEIRKKNIPLYLTGLDASTKQYLLDRAVVRLNEIKKSLQDIFEEMGKAA